VHGLAENALLGGASGAIVVMGIENVQPKVAGLRSRVLVIRDQRTKQSPGVGEGTGGDPNGVPFQDLTINNVPLDATTDTNGITAYTPAILRMDGDDPEFWRVTNSSSDTILDLQVQYDGTPQTLQLVAVDGVSVNSQDGTKPGSTIAITDFRLPPASRMEFIVQPPAPSVKLAQLVTLNIPALANGNGAGDDDPTRPIFNIQVENDARAIAAKLTPGDRIGKSTSFTTASQRFAGIRSAPIAARRTVYFDENQATQQFFMVVQGQPETVFNANAPPAITAKQGTVEEWTVENHALENHEFHFHQVHFLVESQNNFKTNSFKKAPAIDGQFLDMIEVPAWDGNVSDPFPSVTLLIDFRGPDVGTFVFHCHILNHEDQGMMNIVQVVNDDTQAKAPATDKVTPSGAKMEMKMNTQDLQADPSPAPAAPASSPAMSADPRPAPTTGGGGHMRE
jgi:FtsP/CotA-like multicopper oxidase with cupredoxin domain